MLALQEYVYRLASFQVNAKNRSINNTSESIDTSISQVVAHRRECNSNMDMYFPQLLDIRRKSSVHDERPVLGDFSSLVQFSKVINSNQNPDIYSDDVKDPKSSDTAISSTADTNSFLTRKANHVNDLIKIKRRGLSLLEQCVEDIYFDHILSATGDNGICDSGIQPHIHHQIQFLCSLPTRVANIAAHHYSEQSHLRSPRPKYATEHNCSSIPLIDVTRYYHNLEYAWGSVTAHLYHSLLRGLVVPPAVISISSQMLLCILRNNLSICDHDKGINHHMISKSLRMIASVGAYLLDSDIKDGDIASNANRAFLIFLHNNVVPIFIPFLHERQTLLKGLILTMLNSVINYSTTDTCSSVTECTATVLLHLLIYRTAYNELLDGTNVSNPTKGTEHTDAPQNISGERENEEECQIVDRHDKYHLSFAQEWKELSQLVSTFVLEFWIDCRISTNTEEHTNILCSDTCQPLSNRSDIKLLEEVYLPHKRILNALTISEDGNGIFLNRFAEIFYNVLLKPLCTWWASKTSVENGDEVVDNNITSLMATILTTIEFQEPFMSIGKQSGHIGNEKNDFPIFFLTFQAEVTGIIGLNNDRHKESPITVIQSCSFIDVKEHVCYACPISLQKILDGISHRFTVNNYNVRRNGALVAMIYARIQKASLGPLSGDNDDYINKAVSFDEFPNLLEFWIRNTCSICDLSTAQRPILNCVFEPLVNDTPTSNCNVSRRCLSTIQGEITPEIIIPHLPPPTHVKGVNVFPLDPDCLIALVHPYCTSTDILNNDSHPRHKSTKVDAKPFITPFGQYHTDEGEFPTGINDSSTFVYPTPHSDVPQYLTIMEAYRALVGIGTKPNESERDRANSIEGALRVIPRLLRNEFEGSATSLLFDSSRIRRNEEMNTITPFSIVESDIGRKGLNAGNYAKRAEGLLSPIAEQLTLSLVMVDLGPYTTHVSTFLDTQREESLSLLIALCPNIVLHQVSRMLFHCNYSICQRVMLYKSIRRSMILLSEVPLEKEELNTNRDTCSQLHNSNIGDTSAGVNKNVYPPMCPDGTCSDSKRYHHSTISRPLLEGDVSLKSSTVHFMQRLLSEEVVKDTEIGSIVPSLCFFVSRRRRFERKTKMTDEQAKDLFSEESNANIHTVLNKTRRQGTRPLRYHTINRLPVYAVTFVVALLERHDDAEKQHQKKSSSNICGIDSSQINCNTFSFIAEVDMFYCPAELLRCLYCLFDCLSGESSSSSVCSYQLTASLGLRVFPFLLSAVQHPHGTVRAHAWLTASLVVEKSYHAALYITYGISQSDKMLVSVIEWLNRLAVYASAALGSWGILRVSQLGEKSPVNTSGEKVLLTRRALLRFLGVATSIKERYHHH